MTNRGLLLWAKRGSITKTRFRSPKGLIARALTHLLSAELGDRQGSNAVWEAANGGGDALAARSGTGADPTWVAEPPIRQFRNRPRSGRRSARAVTPESPPPAEGGAGASSIPANADRRSGRIGEARRSSARPAKQPPASQPTHCPFRTKGATRTPSATNACTNTKAGLAAARSKRPRIRHERDQRRPGPTRPDDRLPHRAERDARRQGARCSYCWQCRSSGHSWQAAGVRKRRFVAVFALAREWVHERSHVMGPGGVLFACSSSITISAPAARRAGTGRAAPRLEALGGGSCRSWTRAQRPRLRGFDPRAAGMAIPNSAVSRPAADPVRTRPFHYHQCRRFRSWRDDRLRRLITHRRSSLRKDGGARGG